MKFQALGLFLASAFAIPVPVIAEEERMIQEAINLSLLDVHTPYAPGVPRFFTAEPANLPSRSSLEHVHVSDMYLWQLESKASLAEKAQEDALEKVEVAERHAGKAEAGSEEYYRRAALHAEAVANLSDAENAAKASRKALLEERLKQADLESLKIDPKLQTEHHLVLAEQENNDELAAWLRNRLRNQEN